MVKDLLAFVALALWCNTAAGPPFDPVLVLYAGRHPFPAAWAFIVLGSVSAGAGAALEAGLLRLRRRARAKPRAPRRFYAMALLVAASPVPFTLVRAAALAHPPRAWPYAVAVAVGRLPRYVATIALWAVLSPPAWVAPVGAALGIATVVMPLCLRRYRRSPVAAARDTVAAA
jgi:uncharacterized membrane protein YdjX (TVP38/TMEM64 family)